MPMGRSDYPENGGVLACCGAPWAAFLDLCVGLGLERVGLVGVGEVAAFLAPGDDGRPSASRSTRAPVTRGGRGTTSVRRCSSRSATRTSGTRRASRTREKLRRTESAGQARPPPEDARAADALDDQLSLDVEPDAAARDGSAGEAERRRNLGEADPRALAAVSALLPLVLGEPVEQVAVREPHVYSSAYAGPMR